MIRQFECWSYVCNTLFNSREIFGAITKARYFVCKYTSIKTSGLFSYSVLIDETNVSGGNRLFSMMDVTRFQATILLHLRIETD